jgi:ribosomal protein S30
MAPDRSLKQPSPRGFRLSAPAASSAAATAAAGAVAHQELKVDNPRRFSDKPKSGRIPVIRATPGYFSRFERAKSATAAPMGAL